MGKKKSVQLKRTIKYLASCRHPEIINKIIAKSPDNVIKSICNAALNSAQGSVVLKRKERKILAANRALIERLIFKGEPLAAKRQVLTQTGNGIVGVVIPTILGAVLSSLGTELFNHR